MEKYENFEMPTGEKKIKLNQNVKEQPFFLKVRILKEIF